MKWRGTRTRCGTRHHIPSVYYNCNEKALFSFKRDGRQASTTRHKGTKCVDARPMPGTGVIDFCFRGTGRVLDCREYTHCNQKLVNGFADVTVQKDLSTRIPCKWPIVKRVSNRRISPPSHTTKTRGRSPVALVLGRAVDDATLGEASSASREASARIACMKAHMAHEYRCVHLHECV
jgi:hypothetical protein